MLFFLSSADFFQNQLFKQKKIMDPDQANILSDLIWVQTVCKGFQQATLVGKE